MPAGRMTARDLLRVKAARGKELGEIRPETPLTIAHQPQDIRVIVAGGPGTHAVYVPCFGNTRAVMIEGPSGILRVSPRNERPLWIPSRRRLEWPSGAVADIFSADIPDSLRGPQFEAAWCDELAKWRDVETTFDMLQFGLRLGPRPRQLITTTPRPIPLPPPVHSNPASGLGDGEHRPDNGTLHDRAVVHL